MATKPAKPVRKVKYAGRPTKLTPAVRDAICGHILLSLPRDAAADEAGVGKSTFYRWMSQGADDETGIYREFRDAVLAAEARLYQLVTRNFTGIMLNAKDPGTRLNAQKFYLSHRHPQDWSTKSEVRQTGPDGGPVQVAVTVANPLAETVAGLSQERIDELIAKLKG